MIHKQDRLRGTGLFVLYMVSCYQDPGRDLSDLYQRFRRYLVSRKTYAAFVPHVQLLTATGSKTKGITFLTGIALSLYAASWFLSAYSSTFVELTGAHCFIGALTPGSEGPLVWRALAVSSALTNIVPALFLLTLWTRFRNRTRAWSWLFLSAGVLNAQWPVQAWAELSALREGYYFWSASFFLMAVVLRYHSRRHPAVTAPPLSFPTGLPRTAAPAPDVHSF